jgi:hypothetical protein
MGVQAHFRRTKLVLEIIALGHQIGVLWRCHNDFYREDAIVRCSERFLM